MLEMIRVKVIRVMAADDDIRTEIRDRVRLDEIIGPYVALRPSGRNFKGLCPFHSEKTPSFYVNPERGLWRCWGCNAGGDVFDFVQRVENISFVEALERLARQLGLPFRRRGEDKERATERQRLFDINALAARFYREQLKKSDATSAYLRHRGLEEPVLEEFGIGYAPEGWEALLGYLKRQRADLEAAEKAGLLRRGERGLRDYFVDRLIFPIRDSEGRAIGFGARARRADATPKYLNSPETPIFIKGRIWYGLDRARAHIAAAGLAVAVEGYTDVIALHQAGITMTVAALGTALTPQHVDVLRRHTSALTLAYDGDSAGIGAALRNAPMFEEAGLVVRVAAMPPGDDPDSVVRARGANALRALLDSAEPLLDYRLRQIRERYNLREPAERLAMVREAAQAIAQSQSHLVRQEYAGKLIGLVDELVSLSDAERVHDEQAALLGEVRRIALGAQTARLRGQVRAADASVAAGGEDPRRAHTPKPAPPAGQTAPGQRLAEEYVLRAALSDERMAAVAAKRLRPEQFTDSRCRRVAAALIGNNNDDGGASSEAVIRDPALAEEISALLVVEDSRVEEREFGQCLEHIERYALKQRAARLEEEIAKGTLKKSDQRYEEYLQLVRELHGQKVKGDG